MRTLIFAAVVGFIGVSAGYGVQHDVSGTWGFVVELDIGGGEPTFEFVQQGDILSGTYEGTFGTAPVTGTVRGNQIEFSFGDEGNEALYVGTIEGNTMSGTCDYGGVDEGTWEAERQ